MNVSTFIRLEKLHTMDQVAGAGAHNSRSNTPCHANFEQITSNVNLRGGSHTATELLIARFNQAQIQIPLKKRGLHATTKPRHERILAWNALCAVGEEFFKMVDATAWAERTLRYLDETFRLENVLSVVLHFDERVPHLHAIIAPITPQGQLSAAQIYNQDKFNEPEDMDGIRRGNGSVYFLRRLQREFHELCREFDPSLTEPVPGGVMTHRLVAEWREWIARAHRDIPVLPPAQVSEPSLTDKLRPEAYAQRQVEVYRRAITGIVSTLHAKAVLYDEQVASNMHMQRTLQTQDKELSKLKQQLLETQNLFRQMQAQQAGLNLHDLCERLGFPIDANEGRPFTVMPNGVKLDLTDDVKNRSYENQTWTDCPPLRTLAQLMNLTEADFVPALVGVLPPDLIENLVAYRDRLDKREELGRLVGTRIHVLARLKPMDIESRSQLEKNLALNFGIQKSLLDSFTDMAKDLTIGITQRTHLTVQHSTGDSIDGIIVNGTKLTEVTNTPFEQALGWFQESPLVIGGSQARHTVVVSNVVEALSLLSVPELAGSIRIVTSGVTRLEKVAAQILFRAHPVVLIEYGSGRRCGRHRQLRELLRTGGGKPRQLSPSELRLNMAGFETIALKAQQNPGLGSKLASLMGLPAGSGGFEQAPKPFAKPPTPPPVAPVPPDVDVPF
jgi:hypothetical protein